MALASLLPKPKNQTFSESQETPTFQVAKKSTKTAPPYGERAGWIPRNPEDFGDGGAYPEIHVAQYPIGMGRKKGAENSRTLTLQLDNDGKVQYDAIAKRGHTEGRVVHSKLSDMLPKDIKENDPSFDIPSEEDQQKTTEKTRLAIEKLIEGKIKAKLPKQAVDSSTSTPTYIRYTPAQQGRSGEFNSGADSRVIRMVEIQKDPMEPPKYKHKKVPRGPPSPPPPVLHSPPRKVTVKEQNEWKIPPSVSNWKNPKGYTIPLDKRLAADGRGLQETYISDGFAKLSQALLQADKQAHEEVRLRGLVQKKLEEKRNQEHEENLKRIAQQAREERAGRMSKARTEDDQEAKEAKERDEIRADKRREIERELRLSKMSTENRTKILERDQDRDISEKIALGLAKPTANQDLMFDQRLFNKTQGMTSGFGDDDSYGIYDKPLFSGSSANKIYRPGKNLQESYGTEEDMQKLLNTDRFQPDKGFQGAEKSDKNQRSGPVEFERDEKEKEDLFGLDQFLKDARHAKRSNDSSDSRDGKRSKNFEDDRGRRR